MHRRIVFSVLFAVLVFVPVALLTTSALRNLLSGTNAGAMQSLFSVLGGTGVGLIAGLATFVLLLASSRRGEQHARSS
jgi:hypothetical protein